MDESLKKLLVIFGVSFGLFWIFKPKGNEDGKAGSKNPGSKFVRKPIIDDDMLQHDHIRIAYDALCVYIDAVNDGASQTSLDELKADIRSSVGMVIYEDNNGNLAVKDTEGSDILKY